MPCSRHQDNSSDLEKYQKEAEELIAAARADASKVIQDAKKAAEADINAATEETKQVGVYGQRSALVLRCLLASLLGKLAGKTY